MNPPYRFEAQYDETIVLQSTWRFVVRRMGGSWPIWCALVVFSLVHFGIVLSTGDPDIFTAVLAALWIVVLGLLLFGWLLHRRAALRKLRALDAMRASFTFDDEGLTVASRMGSTSLIWAALDVWTFPRFWILTTASNAYFTMRIESAAPEALAFARAKLGDRAK